MEAVLYFACAETAIGDLQIAGDERTLCFLTLAGREGLPALYAHAQRFYPELHLEECEERLASALRELEEYARGERTEFEIELAPAGTEFELRVWSELRRIPYGETRTYGALAQSLGQPGASQAVGGANGRNPIAIAIPCHRCVAATGLGGFSGGLDRKVQLLELERVHAGTGQSLLEFES